jgi:hypothetical protein
MENKENAQQAGVPGLARGSNVPFTAKYVNTRGSAAVRAEDSGRDGNKKW